MTISKRDQHQDLNMNIHITYKDCDRVDGPRKTTTKFSSELKYGHESLLGVRGQDGQTDRWLSITIWPSNLQHNLLYESGLDTTKQSRKLNVHSTHAAESVTCYEADP